MQDMLVQVVIVEKMMTNASEGRNQVQKIKN